MLFSNYAFFFSFDLGFGMLSESSHTIKNTFQIQNASVLLKSNILLLSALYLANNKRGFR